MKLGVTLALAALALAPLSRVTPVRSEILQLTQPVIDTLTPIDSLPSSQQINKVFNDNPGEALVGLQAIANPSGSVDPGVQIRAVRALIHYCVATPCAANDPAHATLIAIEVKYRPARTGSDLLVLRAGIESLGVLKVPGDYSMLQDHLQHPSRDIRAAAARALRDLGNTNAITALRARYNIEPIDQVRSAISDALRVLGQPL